MVNAAALVVAIRIHRLLWTLRRFAPRFSLSTQKRNGRQVVLPTVPALSSVFRRPLEDVLATRYSRHSCRAGARLTWKQLMNSTSASSARCVHACQHDAHLSPEVLLARRLVSAGRRTVAEILYDKLHRAPPEPEGGLEYVSTTGSVDLGPRGVHTSGGSLNRNPFYLTLPEPNSSTLAALPGAAAWGDSRAPGGGVRVERR
jgi:hypothetical protein